MFVVPRRARCPVWCAIADRAGRARALDRRDGARAVRTRRWRRRRCRHDRGAVRVSASAALAMAIAVAYARGRRLERRMAAELDERWAALAERDAGDAARKNLLSWRIAELKPWWSSCWPSARRPCRALPGCSSSPNPWCHPPQIGPPWHAIGLSDLECVAARLEPDPPPSQGRTPPRTLASPLRRATFSPSVRPNAAAPARRPHPRSADQLEQDVPGCQVGTAWTRHHRERARDRRIAEPRVRPVPREDPDVPPDEHEAQPVRARDRDRLRRGRPVDAELRHEHDDNTRSSTADTE